MDADYLVPEFFRSSHPESLTMLRELSKPATLMNRRGRTAADRKSLTA